jgi:hypothetical protein
VDYSPQIVDRWLREWELLTSLSETPATAAHLLSSECRHSDKACGSGKPVGIKSTRSHGDPVRYCDIKADLEQAAAILPPYSLESQVVARRMAESLPMIEIRARLGVDNNRLWAAYRAATKMMARSLGWEEQASANG